MNITLNPYSDDQLLTASGWSICLTQERITYLVRSNLALVLLCPAHMSVLDIALEKGIRSILFCIAQSAECIAFELDGGDSLIFTNADVDESMLTTLPEFGTETTIFTPDTMYIPDQPLKQFHGNPCGRAFDIVRLP